MIHGSTEHQTLPLFSDEQVLSNTIVHGEYALNGIGTYNARPILYYFVSIEIIALTVGMNMVGRLS
jgi:hypothetical protein